MVERRTDGIGLEVYIRIYFEDKFGQN